MSQAFDCPDVTAAVFKSRLDQMKMNIRHGKYFDGREIIYTFHVIEYQYRGLPHANLVVRLDDAPDISLSIFLTVPSEIVPQLKASTL